MKANTIYNSPDINVVGAYIERPTPGGNSILESEFLIVNEPRERRVLKSRQLKTRKGKPAGTEHYWGTITTHEWGLPTKKLMTGRSPEEGVIALARDETNCLVDVIGQVGADYDYPGTDGDLLRRGNYHARISDNDRGNHRPKQNLNDIRWVKPSYFEDQARIIQDRLGRTRQAPSSERDMDAIFLDYRHLTEINLFLDYLMERAVKEQEDRQPVDSFTVLEELTNA